MRSLNFKMSRDLDEPYDTFPKTEWQVDGDAYHEVPSGRAGKCAGTIARNFCLISLRA
jgi:hypothetical protein